MMESGLWDLSRWARVSRAGNSRRAWFASRRHRARNGNEAAEKYPDVRIVRSLDEIGSRYRRFALIAIATPNETHYPSRGNASKPPRRRRRISRLQTTLEEVFAPCGLRRKQVAAHRLSESAL